MNKIYLKVVLTISILCTLTLYTDGQSIEYTEIYPSEKTVSRFALSPTSQYIAISTNTDVAVYTESLTHVVDLPPQHTDEVFGLSWSSKSNFLATAGLDGLIHIWDTSNLPEVIHYKTLIHNKPIWSVGWSPVDDELKLLSVVSEGFLYSSDTATARTTINIWDIPTSTIIYTSSIQYHGAMNAQWSHDGRYIAYPNYTFEEDYNVRFWDTESYEEQSIYGNGSDINDIAWHPDTHRIAYVDSLNFLTIAEKLDNEKYIVDAVFEANIDYQLYSLDWSHASNLIVIGGTTNQVEVWDIEQGKKNDLIFEPHPNTIVQVAWLPNDTYIASVDIDGNLRVWDIKDL